MFLKPAGATEGDVRSFSGLHFREKWLKAFVFDSMRAMLIRAQKLILLLAAGILLFVVLCPATPTPTAVVKNQSVLVLLLTPVFALLWKPSLPMFPGVEDLFFDQHDSGHSILDLTCTRLC